MKERFKKREWKTVSAFPFHVFAAVAMADGEVDRDEISEYLGRMARAAGYKDELHREIMTEAIHADVQDLIERGTGLDPEKTKKILEKRLSDSEYQSFLGSVFVDATKVAGVDGVSDEESKALFGISAFYGVDMGELSRNYSGR